MGVGGGCMVVVIGGGAQWRTSCRRMHVYAVQLRLEHAVCLGDRSTELTGGLPDGLASDGAGRSGSVSDDSRPLLSPPDSTRADVWADIRTSEVLRGGEGPRGERALARVSGAATARERSEGSERENHGTPRTFSSKYGGSSKYVKTGVPC